MNQETGQIKKTGIHPGKLAPLKSRKSRLMALVETGCIDGGRGLREACHPSAASPPVGAHRAHPLPLGDGLRVVHLRFGRIVVSEIQAPNMFVNLV